MCAAFLTGGIREGIFLTFVMGWQVGRSSGMIGTYARRLNKKLSGKPGAVHLIGSE